MLVLYHVSRQAVFHYFLPDDRKQDDATTAEHSKQIIGLLQNRALLFADMITIWENTDDFAEQYRCASYVVVIMNSR